MSDGTEGRMNWVVLSYSLPQGNAASMRVSFWRRLRRIGALSPKVGVHVLPSNDDNVEAFDWMAQEAKHAGGDALVMHVERFEGLPDQTLVEAFNQQRAEAYAELEPEIAALENDLDATAIVRLRRRVDEIAAIDFFQSEEGQRAIIRLQKLQERLRAPRKEKHMPPLRQEYLGRTWVTRPRPFIDRLACAWLIRRFIDANANIRYSADVAANEISFDMPNAVFGHRGSDCTFETMLAEFAIDEPAVVRIGQIVHTIDLRDDRVDAAEAVGIEAVIRGWQRANLPDAEIEQRSCALFDALRETFRAQLRAQ